MRSFSHWSNVFKKDVNFEFYCPDEEDLYPLLYVIPSPPSHTSKTAAADT